MVRAIHTTISYSVKSQMCAWLLREFLLRTMVVVHVPLCDDAAAKLEFEWGNVQMRYGREPVKRKFVPEEKM